MLLDNIRRLKRNPLKEFRVRLSQNKLLRENYTPDTRKLIVFLTLGRDIVNGGILSISSIYEESAKLKHLHGAEVIMCTVPGDPLLLKYTKFNNKNYIYRFSQLLSYFPNLQTLMIHIPEAFVGQFLQNLSETDYSKLQEVKDVHFNIMLQNIDLLSPMKDIDRLKKFGKLTCTTAHERYSTPGMRDKLGFPLHKLSVYLSPEQYNRKEYTEKENLMIVSHDKHPHKAEILNIIAGQFPELRIQVIQNLSYEEFKNVISRAKWALTFGEGLDGYFVETIFSGGISFAAYNSRYFTEDFRCLRTVYHSYELLSQQICADINDLDNETAYSDYQNRQYELCCKYYKYEEYVKNLEMFYKEQYTYK
jgi:hypothetical protein